MKLSTQVSQLEMKAEVMSHENNQLKAILCKVITGNSPYDMSLSDNFQVVPTYQNGKMCELSIMDNHQLIATKTL